MKLDHGKNIESCYGRHRSQGCPARRQAAAAGDLGYGRFMMVQDVMDCDGHITYPTKHDQWFGDIYWLSNAAVKMKPTCRCLKCVETTSGSEKGLVEEFKGPLCRSFLVMLPMFGTPPTTNSFFPGNRSWALSLVRNCRVDRVNLCRC